MDDSLYDHPLIQRYCLCHDVSEVLDVMHQLCCSFGGTKLSYHFTPIFKNQNSDETVIYARGFPEGWIALYDDQHLRQFDPIPDKIMKIGRVMTWGNAIMEADLDENERGFVTKMQEHGLLFGVGMPLWGSHNRHAYASIGFDRPSATDDQCALFVQHMLLQAGHQRICQLTPSDGSRPTLSERETEIMTWIARGKSNPDIGTILGISADTVRTYLTRVFDKLNSRDRVSASIRALQLQLITL